MKTHPSVLLIASTLGLVAVTTADCADKPITASDTVSTTTTIAPATMSPTSSAGTTDVSTAIATALWNDLEVLTFETRTQFAAGVARLVSEVNDQVVALNAKRATMNGTTDTKAWDFAMREMVDSQAYLKSTAAELGKTTPDTWGQAKDKVGQAWTRTQEAYAKVKASTTN